MYIYFVKYNSWNIAPTSLHQSKKHVTWKLQYISMYVKHFYYISLATSPLQVCLIVCKYKHLFPIYINNTSIQASQVGDIPPTLLGHQGHLLQLLLLFLFLSFSFFVPVQHICNYMTFNFLLLSMTPTFLTLKTETCLFWCLHCSKIIVIWIIWKIQTTAINVLLVNISTWLGNYLCRHHF